MDSSTLTPGVAPVIQTMSDVSVKTSKELHESGKNIAVVQCEGFRCLAYLDGETWRDFQTGKELPEVKNLVFRFSV